MLTIDMKTHAQAMGKLYELQKINKQKPNYIFFIYIFFYLKKKKKKKKEEEEENFTYNS
jgi:hypothetical protein